MYCINSVLDCDDTLNVCPAGIILGAVYPARLFFDFIRAHYNCLMVLDDVVTCIV